MILLKSAHNRNGEVTLETYDSTTDEMSIQKTFKGAGNIMWTSDDLEKLHIPNAKDFSIE